MRQLTKLLFLINHLVRNCFIAIAFAVMVASCGGGDQQIAGAVSMLSPISSQVSISTTIKTVVYPTAYNTTAKSPVIDDK